MTAVLQTLKAPSLVTLMDTALNSLANGSSALGIEYDNSTNLYPYLTALELNVTFGTNPTAGSLIPLYLVIAPDNTNYDDNQNISTVYIGAFPLRAVTTAQKVSLIFGGGQTYLKLPPCKLKIAALDSSGQAFPASGSTIKGLLAQNQYN